MKQLQSPTVGSVQLINTKKHYTNYLTFERSRTLKSGVKGVLEVYSKENPSKLLAVYTKVFDFNDSFQHSLWKWNALSHLNKVLGGKNSTGWWSESHPSQTFKRLQKVWAKFENKKTKYDN